MAISSAVLEAMLKAGCTAEQLVAVVKADEEANADRIAEKREKNRIRQQNHRARNAMSRVTECDERDTPSSSPVPLSSPPTPPPIIPQTPSPTPETKRAKRLPADWALPASWGQWAIGEGLSEARVRLEADKFRDYWVGKGGKDATKTDWQATWRNWIRNSGGSSPSRGPPEPRMTAHQQRTAAAKAEIEKFLNPDKRHDPEPPGHTATLDLEPGDFRFERPAGFGTR